MEVHVGENDGAVEAAVGDSVVITLPENGTTGYRWVIEPASDEVVVESDDYLPLGTGAPGAGGQRVVRLRAVRAGTAKVGWSLRRAWESTPSQRRELEITIRP